MNTPQTEQQARRAAIDEVRSMISRIMTNGGLDRDAREWLTDNSLEQTIVGHVVKVSFTKRSGMFPRLVLSLDGKRASRARIMAAVKSAASTRFNG
jgi:hypothetical protein